MFEDEIHCIGVPFVNGFRNNHLHYYEYGFDAKGGRKERKQTPCGTKDMKRHERDENGYGLNIKGLEEL